MVFFICDKCGDPQKKSQVETHNFRCRSHSYSCMDCSVVFTGDSYKSHVKCVSEDQKYGGKNFLAKENKGETKQAEWTEQVERAIDKVSDPMLKATLEQIKGFSNIPRKEAKFINFLKNSVRVRNPDLCSKAWKAIAAEAKAQASSSASTQNGTPNKETQQPIPSTKRKLSPDDDEEQQAESTKKTKSEMEGDAETLFKWKATIKKTLKTAPDQEMRLKKLSKAVLNSYRLTTGDSETSDDSLAATFKAKLEGMQKLQIDHNTVRLVM